MNPFPDNWNYLKAELSWLDRVLMRALSRQKQINQEITKTARNSTDKATSHWWRGFVTLDNAGGGRQVTRSVDPPPHPLGRYGDRIADSQARDIFLGLPSLCQHFGLGEFERNVILLCLSPEINRRYEKLFMVLNDDDSHSRLPTIDLALKLFCRSDQEWQQSRSTLLPTGTLAKKKILQSLPRERVIPSFLAKVLCIEEKFVHFLLSEHTTIATILPKTRHRRRPLENSQSA